MIGLDPALWSSIPRAFQAPQSPLPFSPARFRSVTPQKAAPSNWSRPASVAQFSVPPKQPGHDTLALAAHARPPPRGSTHRYNRGLCLPQARAPRFVSAQALTESKRRKLTDQFRNIMLRVGSHGLLRSILAESAHPEQHVERLLAAFAVNALFRYIACCLTFLDFMQAQPSRHCAGWPDTCSGKPSSSARKTTW